MKLCGSSKLRWAFVQRDDIPQIIYYRFPLREWPTIPRIPGWSILVRAQVFLQSQTRILTRKLGDLTMNSWPTIWTLGMHPSGLNARARGLTLSC